MRWEASHRGDIRILGKVHRHPIVQIREHAQPDTTMLGVRRRPRGNITADAHIPKFRIEAPRYAVRRVLRHPPRRTLSEHSVGGRELRREMAAWRSSLRASRPHQSRRLPAGRRDHLRATGMPGRPHDRTFRRRNHRRSRPAGRRQAENSLELQERSAYCVRLMVDQ